MIRVAVTGNIGSGKSTVCRIFESLGVAVYYADTEARKFYAMPQVASEVRHLFGKQVYDEQGLLIRAELAKLAFSDAERLTSLNGIIHPLVLKDYLSWCDGHAEDAYTLYESALLFESGFFGHFDQTILVLSDPELAMKRVVERDGISAEEFMERKSRQLDDSKKITRAKHIIRNMEGEALIPQVVALHNLLKGIPS